MVVFPKINRQNPDEIKVAISKKRLFQQSVKASGYTPWRREARPRNLAAAQPAVKSSLNQTGLNKFMFRILRSLINIVVAIIELLLTFRLIFEFLVVNPGTPFVAWLYDVTAPLVAPFSKILPDWKISGFVVDFATVAALIVFALAGTLLLMLIPCSRKVVITEEVPPAV